jgi:type VI protein secretion system component Hcp
MARDVYIKFGETEETDAFGKPRPEIEGDSDDEQHFWWSEVRECSFSIRAAEKPPEPEEGGGSGGSEAAPAEVPRPKLEKVTIGKKVDWGSADLFRLCCQSPMDLKTNKDIDPNEDKGQLANVVIEVCRRSGVASEGRYPFLVITFGGVYVVGYKIEFSGPDPMEEITLKYGRLSYTYISANPYTGGKMDVYNARNMNGFPVQRTAPAAASATAPAAAAPGAGGGSIAPVVAVTPGDSGGGAAAQPTGPAPDAAIAANFPGYMSVAGNGLLPD